MNTPRSFMAIILTLVTMLCVSTAQAAGPSFPNEQVPVFNIPRMSKAPVCDGNIQPEEWRQSVKLAGVAEISTTKYYDRPHTFYLGWDDEHLYIAGRAHILPGFELSRSKRDKYTSGVVFDDAFEFGIDLLGRNQQAGEAASFFKFILNSLGSGEYLKMYPSIGQFMYNWTPDMAIGNQVHDTPEGRFWEIEIAMNLADLQLPAKMKTGDKLRMLFATDLKNPGWQWVCVPSSSGYLEPYGYPVITLNDESPYVQIERLEGLSDEKLDLRSVIYNPTNHESTVHVQVTAGNRDVQPVNIDRTITLKANSSERLDVEQSLAGAGSGSYSYLVTPVSNTAVDPIFKYYLSYAKDTVKPYLHGTSTNPVFGMEMTYNPVQNLLVVAGDALDAKIPAGTSVAGMRYEVSLGENVVYSGKSTQAVSYWYRCFNKLPVLTPGNYTVTVYLLDNQGKTLLSRSDRFTKKDEVKEFATWWNNKIGDDEKVLKPFTPLVVKKGAKGATAVNCTRRVYEFDSLGLPARINANNGEVLTAPAHIVMTINGATYTVPTKPTLTITSRKDWRIEFIGAPVEVAGVVFSSKGWMEQDGLVNIDLTYAAKKLPVHIQDLHVEWPLNDTDGNYITCIGTGANWSCRFIDKAPDGQGMVWNTLDNMGKVGSGMQQGNFYTNLWVGNEMRGLLWAADSDQGWYPNDKMPAHSLYRNGRTLIMRNNLISTFPGEAPVLLEGARTVQLQFNASPFRNLPQGWRLNEISACNGFSEPPKYKWNWDTGKEYFSTLSPPFEDTKRWPEYYAYCKQVAQERSKQGLYSIGPRLRPYLTNQIATRGYEAKTQEPGLYDYFGADWNMGHETLNKSYIDYMVYLMNRQVREGGAAHFYFDISMVDFESKLASGFGYLLPDGRIQPTGMDTTLRNWNKRVWAMLQENNLYPGGISGHATNSFVLKALPFDDVIIDSEFPFQDAITTFPMNRMISMSCPHSFGTNINHLGYMNTYWATIHDSNLGGGDGLFGTNEFREFGITRPDVQFVPYWRNGNVVKYSAPGLITSLWKRPGAAVLGIMNYGLDATGQEKTRNCAMILDLKELGIPASVNASQIRVADFWNGRQIIPDRYYNIFKWYQELPGPKDQKVRPTAKPLLDAVTGALTGFNIFYHDMRFILVTWDETTTDATKDMFTGITRTAVLDWGINLRETKILTATEVKALLPVTSGQADVNAWKRSDSLLLRVINSTPTAQTVKIQMNLDKLGLKVTHLWEQFYHPAGILGSGNGFDGAAETWSMSLQPGEVRVVTLTRN